MILWGWTLIGSTSGQLGKLVNVSINGLTEDEIDVSNSDSPGRWNEFEPGFKDPGIIAADLLFEPSNLETVLAAFAADNETWQLKKDTKTYTVVGHIRSVTVELPLRTAASHPVEIRCSGAPSFQSSSSSSSSSSA